MRQLTLHIDSLLAEQMEKLIIKRDEYARMLHAISVGAVLIDEADYIHVTFSYGAVGYLNLMRLCVPEQCLLPFPELLTDVPIVSAIQR